MPRASQRDLQGLYAVWQCVVTLAISVVPPSSACWQCVMVLSRHVENISKAGAISLFTITSYQLPVAMVFGTICVFQVINDFES